MMKTLNQFLAKWPFHFLLLPLFFVLHSYMQYYGLINAATALKVLLKTAIAFIVFFGLLLFFTKKVDRSAGITTLLGCTVLFYGVVKDFFNETLKIHFLARYSVLFPLMVVLCILAISSISRKRDFNKLNRFLNILLLLFLLTELISVIASGTGAYQQRNQLVKNNIVKTESLPVVSGGPDVYFLVFDSYPGTGFLQENLQYKNQLDAALEKKDFYVARHSESNYNRTAFSIASTLNFEYLQNIPDSSQLLPRHYNQASLSIEHAAATAVFLHNGYQLLNLSVFDLQQQPSMQRENFLVLPEENMLLYNTLIERSRQDIFWHFPLLKYGSVHPSEKQKQQYLHSFTEENLKKKNFNNILIAGCQSRYY